MPGGGALSAPIPSPTTASLILVQAGVTAMPGVVDLSAKVPSVSALSGWDLDETTDSAAAHVKIYDGTTAAGIEIADIVIPSGGNNNPGVGYAPVQVFNGALFLQVVSGSVSGMAAFLL